jgi:hypothetical protein
MTSNTAVVPLRKPDEVDNPVTAVLRSGARRLLPQAIEAKAEAFLAAMKSVAPPNGRETPNLMRSGRRPLRDRGRQSGGHPALRGGRAQAEFAHRHPNLIRYTHFCV